MEKFQIAHYKKGDSTLYINGGTLTVSDTEYIVHYMFKEAARFAAENTTVTKAPSEPLYDGITLTDGNTSIDLHFFKNTAEKIYELFQL